MQICGKKWDFFIDNAKVLLYNKSTTGEVSPREVEMAKFMLGNYRHSLDDKNRVRIPVKFREVLGARPYYLPGKGGCMYIVPENSFDSMFSSYFNQNPYMSESEDFTTLIFGCSGELEEDSTGRVSIDKGITDKFNFKKEVVFVGKATYVEMWPAEVWDEKFGALDPNKISKMIEGLKKRGA